MKKIFLFVPIALLTGAVLFTACKKDSKDNSTDTSKADLTTHADDQARFDAELDAVSNDGDIVLESTGSFAGRFEGEQGIICDGSVAVNTDSDPMTITITYDGTNCNGTRTRTGVVKFSMAKNSQWKTAGTAVTVTLQSLKITRTLDNKSITLNGSQTYTNVSGGLLINLVSTSITHSIASSGLSVTFDDGSVRNWQVSKKRVFSYNNGVVITTTGTHSEAGADNIAEWGTNRFGGAFTTAITSPMIVRQDCSFRLTSGEIKHTIPSISATATFGLSAAGLPVSCPVGSYFYRLAWTGPAGNTFSLLLPY
ncbi:MAG TPA: hypothetical protein VK644_14450 [Chitinophagaceae bacterium]|nr:hypothetical protein [Chitinophagaceae bacterium]